MIERFGTTQLFDGSALIESHGDGVYAAYDTSTRDITTVTADGVRTTLTGNLGYGYGFEVLTDGAYVIYGLANYGQETGAAVRIINADGSARTSFIDETGSEDLRGVSLGATSDGGFAIGATSNLHGTEQVTITYPQDSGNGSTSGSVPRAGDIVLGVFNGQGTGNGYTPLNDGDIRSYSGATAPDTAFQQNNAATVGLSNGSVVEVFHDYIVVGNPIPASGYGGGYNLQNIMSLRIVSANGTVSQNIQVNTEAPTPYSSTAGDGQVLINPAGYVVNGGGGAQVVSLGGDGFAVVWHEQSVVRDSGVFGGYRFDGTDTKIRYFDVNGNALTDEIQVAHRSADLGNIPANVGIDALGDGRIALVFQDGHYAPNGATAGQLFVSIIGVLGSTVETSAITGAPVAGVAYYDLDVANLGGDRFAVSYNGPEQYGGAAHGHVQTFAAGRDIAGHDYGESLTGGYGPDQILGLGGNDTIDGGDGSDTLDGGAADDVVSGAGGNDLFIVSAGADQFNGGAGLDIADFSGLGQGVTIDLNLTTAQAISGGSIKLTLVENLVGTGLADKFTGSSAANSLDGGAGADTLDGGVGADTLIGGLGADSMTGGAGNDIFYVDNAGDKVIEALNGGTDIVHTTLSTYTLTANVETLYMDGTGANIARGNDLSNRVYGNSGDDRFVVDSGGADTFYGGNGIDSFDARSSATGIVLHLENQSLNAGAIAGDTFGSVERFSGSNTAGDSMTANAGRAYFVGGGGNDTLIGGANNDQLIGGDGADSLVGGGARDVLWGGAGNDTMSGGTTADRDYFQFGEANFGNDLITDFQDGIDVLKFLSSVADDVSDFTITGNGTHDVVLTLTGTSNSVTLHNDAANITITAKDFLFY